MAIYETFDGSAFKVTEQEHAEKTIVGMPDVPGLSAAEMQQKLEAYTDFVAKEKLNGLIDRLGDSAFFRAGGGAGGLDFAVIAVVDKILLPLTAKENTVAIISEMAVPWYYIKDKQPVGEVETGAVWIATGSNERLYFNPLKKNEIGIEPVMAYQYENGNWKNVAACVYLNGGWLDLNFEIYNHGASPVAWSAGGVSGNGTGSNVIGDTGDYLRVYVSQSNSWYGGAIVSNTPISMKGYRTLKFEVPYFVRGQGSGQIGIYTSRTILNVTTNAATSAVASLLIDLPGTYSFDITNLNGDYYVGLTARAGSTTRVSESRCTKIWME